MVNIGNMMKQAQQLQKKMSAAQEKLNEIGYDGTVSAEPFNKELNNLNNEEAAKATYQALRESFEKDGV